MFSGPEGRDKLVITMVGHVDPVPMGVVKVSPRKLTVGRLPLGRVTVRELVINNTGNAPLTVTRVVSKKFKTVYFDAATNGGPLSIPAGSSATVELTLKPTKPGRYLDYVMIMGEARNVTAKGYKVVVIGKAE